MEISSDRWATKPRGANWRTWRCHGVVAPEFTTDHCNKKPGAPLTTIVIYYSFCSSPMCQSPSHPQRRLPCCFLLTQRTASCKPSPSSVRPCSSTEPINPFSFPFLSSTDSLKYSFGLLITTRHEADGPGYTDTIIARSSSLHCLEACLYLSSNPFCHFWPSSHYFIFFHIKLNEPLVRLHISY